MATQVKDEWEQYVVNTPSQDEDWEQYVVKKNKPTYYGNSLDRLGLGIMDTITGGGATAIDNLIARKLNQPQIDKDAIDYQVGRALGFLPLATGVSKAVNLVPQIAKNTIPRALARGGVEGAISGAIGTPEDRKSGAIGGAFLGSLTASFPKVFNLGGRKTAQKIAEKADKGFNVIGKNLQNKYDQLFENLSKAKYDPNAPNTYVNAKDLLPSIDEAINLAPEQQGALKAIKTRLEGLAEGGGKLSAKELHNLKQEIRRTIPKGVWNGSQDADAIINSRRDIYFDIAKKMEDIGGDKYKGLTQEYAKFKQAERLAKPSFYRSGVASNDALNRTLDIPATRAMNYLNNQLPNEQQFMQDFLAWRRGQALKSGARAALPWAGAGGAFWAGSRFGQ